MSGGEAVREARVRLKGTRGFVLTDADGRFRLPLEVESKRHAALTVTAAKPGFFIAGRSADEAMVIQLEPLPNRDNPNYAWVDPTPDDAQAQNCGNCHHEIFDQWHSGGHAQAATNEHFLNLYAGTTWQSSERHGWSLLDEYPEGAGVCSSCHAPSAPLDTLGVTDIRELTGVVRQGVHCDFCHKVHEIHLPARGLTHGRFGMNLLRPSHDQLFFGPMDDVNRNEDSYLPVQSQSQFCAPCHEGIVFGVPVYTTYSEWLASPARAEGKQCQSCHMRPDGQMTNVAPGAGGIERDPATLASHTLLPGGRQTMLRRAVTVAPRAQMNGDGQTIRLTVRLSVDDVGHRVPTGFIDRHLILCVEAHDVAGQAVEPLDGPRLPDWIGDEANRPGMLFAKLLVDAEGDSPVPFWRAGTSIVDNRLDPGVDRDVEFHLPSGVSQVDIRLIFRGFWQTIAKEKNWPDPSLEIVRQTWAISDLLVR